MITKLTDEQEAQIPKFIAKWVKQASEPTNREVATIAIKELYKRMGEDEPIVIFGRSPNETILMALTVFGIVKDYDWNSSQLDLQLYSQLDSQLDSQLRSQLRSQLYSQLRSQLYSQLNSQLDSQLDSQLRSQLRSQLHSQLHSQLYSQLHSQLYSQLHSQLYSQLDSQLYSQLNSQLYSQLRSQLNSESDTIVKGWLQSIRSTFYEHDWWLVWCGWYDYGQYIGVEFDKENYDLFMNFNKNVGLTIPYKGIVFMSDRPTAIRWNNQLLHYDHGKAVEWADGYGYYMIDGVGFDEDTYNRIMNHETDITDMTSEKLSADQRAVVLKWLSPEKLIDQLGAELINESDFTGTKLYKVDDFAKKVISKISTDEDNFDTTERTEHFILMKHPSLDTNYLEWVHPDTVKENPTADYAQAKAFGVAEEDLSLPGMAESIADVYIKSIKA